MSYQLGSQQSVIVTGCGSGIGKATVQLLCDKKYRVFGLTRNSKELGSLERLGATIIETDLGAPSSVYESICSILRMDGLSICGLVNNAGFDQFGALEDLSREALRNQFEINTFAPQDLINSIIPLFRKQGYGRIIQISSMQSFFPMPYQGSYNASKAALEMLTDTMRIELRNTGVHFSIIQAGPTTTNIKKTALKLLRQKVDINRSVHAVAYTKLVRKLDSSQPVLFEVHPQVVAKIVYRALTSRSPKTRYRVSVPSRLTSWAKFVLTDKQLDRLITIIQDIKN